MQGSKYIDVEYFTHISHDKRVCMIFPEMMLNVVLVNTGLLLNVGASRKNSALISIFGGYSIFCFAGYNLSIFRWHIGCKE